MDKIDTTFDDNGMPKESSHGVCLSVILLDSVFKMCKNYYSQVFLEECEYVIEENKMSKFIKKELGFRLRTDQN